MEWTPLVIPLIGISAVGTPGKILVHMSRETSPCNCDTPLHKQQVLELGCSHTEFSMYLGFSRPKVVSS